MPDRTLNLWRELYEWQRSRGHINELNAGADPGEIAKLEGLLGESLPEGFKALYLAHDGEKQKRDGEPVLFGHGFMPLAKVIKQTEWSLSQVKPAHRTFADPAEWKLVADELVECVKKLARGKAWEKITFACSADSLEGPYQYPKDPLKERTILEKRGGTSKEFWALAQKLENLEKKSYNWDELEFTVHHTGEYEVVRKDFDLAEYATSFPEGAIKLRYFHPKWIPIFEDFGGNYMGCDLDPGVSGVKGQIIIFGRDDDAMFVAENSLAEFFEMFLDDCRRHEAEGTANPFVAGAHLHDLLRGRLVKS